MGVWLAILIAAGPSLDAALAKEAAGDDAGALAVAEQVERAQPAWALAHLEGGRLALKLGELDRARLEISIGCVLAPENPRGQFLQGELLEEQGVFDEAAQAFERALDYRAGYEDAHRHLGTLYLQLGDPHRAEQHLQEALAASPGDLLLQLQLAQAVEAEGRVDDAQRTLELAHRAHPAARLVTERLAAFYRRHGLADRADALEEALRRPARKLRPLRPSRR